MHHGTIRGLIAPSPSGPDQGREALTLKAASSKAGGEVLLGCGLSFSFSGALAAWLRNVLFAGAARLAKDALLQVPESRSGHVKRGFVVDAP